MRVVVSALALALLATACPKEEAPPATPPTDGLPADGKPADGAPPAPPTPPVAEAPTGPQLPEPAGIAAGSHKPPEAPAGKGTWLVDTDKTTIAFHITSNSAGVITGKFPSGAAGAVDAKGKGVFSVNLTTMVSTGKDGSVNPLRDTNVIEAFFAARPFAAGQKDLVAAAWQKLAGKIASGVPTASLVVESIDAKLLGVKAGKSTEGVVSGNLILWDSVVVPVSFPVSASRNKDVILVKGTAPATFNIEEVTGSGIRKALFDTMLAAGCAHQPGIQNDVSVVLEQVTLLLQKK